MRNRLNVVLVSCILILSVILIAGNFGFNATSPENNNGESAKPVPIDSRQAPVYHWGDMYVVSEPLAGQNWNYHESKQTSIAVENDKIYVVWEDRSEYNGAGSDYDIFYNYFDGSKWSDVQVISEPIFGDDQSSGGSSSPAIAVENGNVYVVWQDYNDTNGAGGADPDIFYRCNLMGNGWEDIQVLSEPVPGKDLNDEFSQEASIAVENGNIYVTWQDRNDTNGAAITDFDIFYRCNLTGTNWETVQIISEPVPNSDINTKDSRNPSIAVENDQIYVVWTDANNTYNAGLDLDIFYSANLTGSSWEAVQVISEPVSGQGFNDQGSYSAEIAVENDKIYVVWEDENETNNAGTDADIFYRCNLTGSNWEDVQVISEPVPGQGFNDQASYSPEIAVENDVIYVVWEDWNDTKGSASTDDDIFYKTNFTGLSWEDVQVISEPLGGSDINIGSSAWAAIAVGNGKSHIVWQDNTNWNGAGTDHDIFYRCTFLPPVLSQDGVTPSFGNTSTFFNFTVTYSDADNEEPTVMVLNISNNEFPMMEADPADTNYLNGKSYYYNTTLDIGDSYNYYFRCFDGYYSRSTTPIDEPDVFNTPPEIMTADVTTATEDVYYEVYYEYEDIDIVNVGQIGTWSLNSEATWLAINATTGVLSGTPTQNNVGPFWVNITINDTIDFDWTNFTLEVEPVNDPPLLVTEVLPIAQEDEFYEVEFEVEDVDSPLLTWMIVTNAAWLNVNNSQAKFNGTPGNDDVGDELWVNVSVNDGEFSDNRNFSLIVNNTNDPPKIKSMELVVPQVGKQFSMIFAAEDIDPPPIIFTWAIETNTGSWLQINTATGELYGTPTENDVGEFWLNVSVDDGDGGSDYTNFTLNVELDFENLAPEITTTDETYVMVNTTYSVIYEATDDHTELIDLTWTWISNAGWLDFNATSHELSGSPAEIDVGEYWVNISVTDESDLSTYHNFTITVSTVPPNHAPGLSNSKISPTSGDTDTDFTFTVTYNDEDNDSGNVYIWIDGEERKMTPDPSDTDYTDGVDYTYETKLDEGEHDYYFIADDGELDAVTTDTTPTSSTDAETTPSITEAKGDDKEASEGDDNWWIWVLLTFIIMLILVFVAFAIGKRSGAAQAAYGPPSGDAPLTEEEAEEEWEDAEEEKPEEEWEEDEEGEEPEDLEKEAADEEMDEEIEEEEWDDEAKDEDEDIAEDETEDEAEEDWDEEQILLYLTSGVTGVELTYRHIREYSLIYCHSREYRIFLDMAPILVTPGTPATPG